MDTDFLRNLSADYVTPSEEMKVINTTPYRWCHKISMQKDGKRRKVEYLNIPTALDIETSSFYDNGRKVGIMYEWSFGIFGRVVIGRTWEEFDKLFQDLHQRFQTSKRRRIIVYVHSLAYEFQFIRKRFKWLNVFSLDNRKPVYAVTDTGIEFRCSYILSGYSLSTIGKNLLTYKVQKMVGDLDYSLIRHSGTPMTETEIGYCVNDVRVVMAYVQEKIDRDGSIAKIQLTKTGYVRKFCRNTCFHAEEKNGFKRLRYMDIMKGLTLDVPEYKQLRRAFAGGFTHADSFYARKVVRDVYSYDFTSSYPAVMVSEKFPMSSAEVVTISSMAEFRRNLKLYCCLFDVVFYDLESTVFFDHYISESKCWDVQEATVDNGRVVSARSLKTTITEQDFAIIEKMYKWSKIGIGVFRRYRRDYLPKDLILAILSLYGKKTTLKGVAGMEAEYLSGKEDVNAAYGMIVMAVIRDVYGYSDDWEEPKKPDEKTEIENYNKSANRFLFYPWGVWVTAYARRNLFSGILSLREDYVYADTDSVKFVHPEKHTDYFSRYDDQITAKMRKMCETLGIDFALTRPKTVKGVEKPLGVWDRDAHYARFKTLGAKRYLVEYAADEWNDPKDHGRVNLTVSGLNKQTCVPFLLSTGDPFAAFDDDLLVPAEFTGKMTHTYIDERRTGVVVDYTGTPGTYDEFSAVHMEPAEYNLSLSQEYVDFIMSVQQTETGEG